MLASLKPSNVVRVKGFTLIELLITLTIVGIVLGVAVSGFSSWLTRTKTEETAASLQRSLSHARSEAIKHGGRIYFCGTNDGSACSATLNNGWIIFLDSDNSSQVDNGETVISLVRLDPGNFRIVLADIANAGAVSGVAYNHRGYSTPAVSASITRGTYSESFTMNRSGNFQ